MRTSEDTTELVTALVGAQSQFTFIPKTHTAKVQTKTGGEYSYRYADLADTVMMAAPILVLAGLAIAQVPERIDGEDVLTTRLSHVSGQWIEGSMRVFLAQDTPQGQGSAITYARRYAYCSILGIVADEDDDGALTQPQIPASERLAARAENIAATTHREAPARSVNTARSSGGRVYLTVPYASKDEAKARGARWDKDAPQPDSAKFGRWHVPDGADPNPFAAWFDERDIVQSQLTVVPEYEPDEEPF